MEHIEQPHAHKKEPGFEPAAAAASVIAAGEMPAWLNNAPAAPTAGQRWGRRFMFIGVALVTIALTAGATMLGLELYESHSSMEVVAAHSQAEVAGRAVQPPAAPAGQAVPFVEKRESSLPPLVMLAQDPNAAHKKEPGAGAAAVAAVPPAAVSTPGAAAVTQPDAAAKVVAPKVVAPAVAAPVERPAVAHTTEKPVVEAPPAAAHQAEKPEAPAKPLKSAAQPPKKLAVAKHTTAAVAKKAAVTAKRIATPELAKAHTRAKPIKGTMLQPPRDLGLDPAFQDPPRQAIDRRCRPGELARECEARIR